MKRVTSQIVHRSRRNAGLAVMISAVAAFSMPLPAIAQIVNEGQVTATPPGGAPGSVFDSDSVTIETVPPQSSIAVAVSVVGGGPSIVSGANPDITDAGDQITYEFAVTNTGEATLFNVALASPGPQFGDASAAGTWSAPERVAAAGPDGDEALAPQETWLYRSTYVLAQADIDAAVIAPDSVVNTVSVTATDPAGGVVEPDAEDNASVLLAQTSIASMPSIAIEKVAKNGDTIQAIDWAVGDVVTYEFTVTNTGNVVLADVTVTDGPETFTGQGALSPVTPESVAQLAPGEQAVFTATYTIVQADIDAQ